MYVDIILPLPLDSTFTYLIPQGLEQKICVGGRVIVPFGNSKLYTGIVTNIHEDKPQGDYTIKEIQEVLDNTPIVTAAQLQFWKWMSQYYMCSIGDVFKAAVPSGMKLESESQLVLKEEFDAWEKLTKKEMETLEILQTQKFKNIAQIQKHTKDKRIIGILKSLMEKKALIISEEIKNTFNPKKEIHVRIPKEYQSERALNELSESLAKQPKRYQLLMKYLEMSGMVSALTLKNKQLIQEVSRTDLLKASGISSAVLIGMRSKGYLETYEYEVGRLKAPKTSITEQLPLSDAQQETYDAIVESFKQKKVCLLHGVTSSGKTEIYIRLIRQKINAGKQVLYLLPEIALTTQITQRLSRIFGDKLGVYHSKYPDNERIEIWNKQLSAKPYQIILGVRSSLFLPYQNLGLIIVDEEHETSYKQQDPSPRYSARDTAIVLASSFKAPTLLGTATPSMETFHNAQQGKYGYVSLSKRYGNMQLPKIEVVDIKDLLHRKMMKYPFSPRLEEEMRKALDNGEQIILFQNRRGYTPVLECKTCGWVPKCQFCDVNLTYHQNFNKLVCHYCGNSYNVPRQCPNCQETEIRSIGFGTEKIEEEVKKRFPLARTARLDLDTTRTKNAYEQILFNFSQHNTDILIGTQMVSKGLDFDNVHVVGILDADTMLTRSDFRAFERSFQMMSQVAGRAGRHNKQGYVILQTKHADLPVIQQIVDNDYEAMFHEQQIERKNFVYPPYCRMIYIYLKHRDDKVVGEASQILANMLRQSFTDTILGPDRPAIGRIQLQYIRKIILKVIPQYSQTQTRAILKACVENLLKTPQFHSVNVYFDVDPLQ
ncbi:MAG: primosomal protein N' [Alistipes sp.]|nr:primosomal protein N' [Candidatus Alistipes equi]